MVVCLWGSVHLLCQIIILYVPFIGRRSESYILRETDIEPQHEPVNRIVSETTQLERTLKQ